MGEIEDPDVFEDLCHMGRYCGLVGGYELYGWWGLVSAIAGVAVVWAGGVGCTPLSGDVSVWGCFLGFFVVWRVFLGSLGVILLLFSY